MLYGAKIMYCTSASSLHLKQQSWPLWIASQVRMMGIGSKVLLEDWQISWYLGIFGWYATLNLLYIIYIYIYRVSRQENIHKWWGSLETFIIWQTQTKSSRISQLCLNFPDVDEKLCWTLVIRWDFRPDSKKGEGEVHWDPPLNMRQ